MKNLRKFTLIELLVVVAIIGILVTILMPSLSSAREKAKIAVCLNNQKQMATAYITYASVNNQDVILHQWYNDIVGYKGNHGWAPYTEEERPLNQYASPGVGQCPSDKGDPWYGWNNNEGFQFGSSYLVSYATSSNIDKSTNITNSAGKVWSSGIKLIKFDYPEKKILFYNVILTFARDWNHTSGKAKWHSEKFAKYPVAFADGHAEFYNFSWKTITGNKPKGNIDWRINNLGYY